MRIPKKLETKIDKLLDLENDIKIAKAQLEKSPQYKMLKRFEDEYSQLHASLIGQHSVEDLIEARGKKSLLGVTQRTNYKITEWNELCKFISRRKAFDIFQRRVTSSAVIERELAGVEVPGLEKYTSITVKPKTL